MDARACISVSFTHIYIMEISHVGVQTRPSKRKLTSKRNQAATVTMNNETLNINDIMKELIPKRLQTENFSSNHIYVLHWSRDYSCSFPKPV